MGVVILKGLDAAEIWITRLYVRITAVDIGVWVMALLKAVGRTYYFVEVKFLPSTCW
jgi:hypothetical protein